MSFRAVIECDSCHQRADIRYHQLPHGWAEDPLHADQHLCPWGCAERLAPQPKHMKAAV